jgi:hypothetical protein
MFAKSSRYRKLPDIVVTDAKGRTVASKTLRLLPAVSGTFLHTVEEVDRLDRLAFTYYQQPRNWWHICDANPEFLAPQALLGTEPIVTTRLPLTPEAEDDQPPWAALLDSLSGMVGVERVQVVEEAAELVPQDRDAAGQTVTVLVPRYERAVIVTHNRLNVSVTALVQVVARAGFLAGPPEPSGRVGKPIVIPPAVVG